MKKVNLTHEWTLGETIGSGGFGKVRRAKSSLCECAVAKIFPKLAGADRELLFVNNKDLDGVRNIVPIIDSGEDNNSWVLIMPMAEKSLRQHLDKTTDRLSLPSVVKILSDIAKSLVEIDKKNIVHRDIKPENILLLNGHWCLADFGISRYAESTTATDTRKFAFSPCYAAPERWRNERASIATDIYSLGVIAYELLSKSPPLPGPMTEDFREQHLNVNPPSLTNTPAWLEALVNECLYKSPEARPNPANVLQRLGQIETKKQLEGLAKLEEANLAEVNRQSETSRRQLEQKSEAERRKKLFTIASKELINLTNNLRKAIERAAPSAIPQDNSDGWVIPLGQARLEFKKAITTLQNPWGEWDSPKFDVIAHASLILHIPLNEHMGRSHSLWYADAQKSNHYRWFETAFMTSPICQPDYSAQEPFALSPGQYSAEALRPATGTHQVAWRFTPLIDGDLDEFINRWAGWFADATKGQLCKPSSMPEHPTEGSWRG